MKRLAAAHVILGVVLAACSKPDAELVVVLQAWRNADYAQQVCERTRIWQQQNRDRIARVGCESVTACPEMLPLIARCAADPIGDLRRFESEFLARAAAEPRCKGIRIVRIDDRNNPAKAADVPDEPHWRLHFDYQPGDPQQRWWMTDNDSRATFPKGEGGPSEIAADVCAIAAERGARFLN